MYICGIVPTHRTFCQLCHCIENQNAIPFVCFLLCQGIVPTLLIVRVGLGISMDDVETSIATFRAAENGREMTTLGRGVHENVVLNITAGEEGGPDGVWISNDGAHAKASVARVA